MFPSAHKPGNYLVTLSVLLVCLLCSFKTTVAQVTDVNPAEPIAKVAAASGIELPAPQPGTRILVLLGLREQANKLVELAVAEEFGELDVQLVDILAAASPDYRWPQVDTVVTAGRRGCQLALQAVHDTRIFCTLLTEEGFHGLDTSHREPKAPSLSALVIDQPASRQMQIAHRVYPALAKFSIFSGHGIGVDTNEILAAAEVFPYRSTVPLPTQLGDALSAHDALIATSDSEIYNASTLSTVLLTAYGYGKPVIGFSRAYVKAGALITCYSTPGQILRQVASYLAAEPTSGMPNGKTFYPDYFSVVDNPRVARSLGLIDEFRITPSETYTDADFEP